MIGKSITISNMKKLLTFFLPIISLSLVGCKNEYKHLMNMGDANVILIFGQSNASGNSPWEYLETKNNEVYNTFKAGTDNVLVSWNVVHNKNKYFEPCRFGMADHTAFFGPEIGIADVFRKESTTTYIIKYALGGSNLNEQWLNKNAERGDLYNSSIDWVNKKIKYLKRNNVTPHIKGIFWMQGESDSFEGSYDKYENNLRHLINYYREDLKPYYDETLPFVDAYISNKTVWWQADEINRQKQVVADSDPNNYVIKTNGEDANALDLNVKSASSEGDDGAHYDSVSEVLLGQTIAEIIRNNF